MIRSKEPGAEAEQDTKRVLHRLNRATFAVAFLISSVVFGTLIPVSGAVAAPYAAMVMDARTGKVLHSRNADTRLHPASLTKMMTLYVVFSAIERGEIGLDTMVKVSKKAAAEQPSKIGLRAGQRIKLRYLIRAAAIKSANDAARIR
jgi:D-alanyl-D-alanine carboxypeptidase